MTATDSSLPVKKVAAISSQVPQVLGTGTLGRMQFPNTFLGRRGFFKKVKLPSQRTPGPSGGQGARSIQRSPDFS